MKRAFGLDLLRVILISLVVVQHFMDVDSRHPDWLIPAKPNGQFAVQAFFVLSSWLLAPRLIEGMPATAFLVSRWAKTIPPYMSMVLILVALGTISTNNVWRYLTFTQNFQPVMEWVVSWSLCAEEQFYLSLPFILWGLRVVRAPIAFVLVCLLSVFSPVMRWIEISEMQSLIHTTTYVRLDGFVVGTLLVFLKVRDHVVWKVLSKRKAPLAAMGVFLSITCIWRSHIYGGVWFYLVSSLAAGMCLPVLDNWHREGRVAGFFVLASKGTYSVYLTHLLAQELAANMDATWAIRFICGLVLTVLFSFALYQLIERRFSRSSKLDLRRKQSIYAH